MIAEYPHFSKLGLNHTEDIKRITSVFEPYHDFSIVNLICWNTDGSAEVSLLNGNLVVRLPDYVTGKPVVTLLGSHKIEETVRQLLADFRELGMVPEAVAKRINAQGLSAQEDRDNFDYFYRLEDIVRLAGGQYKQKRNKANSVRRILAEHMTTTRTSEVDDRTAEEILELYDLWSATSKQSAEELRFERTALSSLLDNRHHFQLLFTLVRIEDRLKAFSINELADQQWAICHFEKALSSAHTHMATFVAHHASVDLMESGRTLVNWEPDLGIPGLRRIKMSYHPAGFLKKYKVSRA